MKQPPRVSIIMRTQDRPLFLQRAIDSVLAQTYQDWQLVLLDDAGNRAAIDGVLAPRRAALGERLFEIHNTESRGRKAACNTGVRAASGEFITFLDDDDTWDPRFLENSFAFLASAPKIWAGVSCLVDLVFESVQEGEVVFKERRAQDPGLSAIDFSVVLGPGGLCNHSFIYRREVWEELGGYREDFPVAGDREFWGRLILKYDIFLIRETLAYYHIRVQDAALGIEAQNSAQSFLHENYAAHLRNEQVRADLRDGTLSLGEYDLLRNLLSPELHEQNRLLFEIKEHLRHQDPVYWLRRLSDTWREKSRRCRERINTKLGR